MAMTATVAVATATYPATAQFTADKGGTVTLCHLGSSNNITFSFDGTNDAGTLVPGYVPNLQTDGWVYSKVWLKGASATSTNVLIIVEDSGVKP